MEKLRTLLPENKKIRRRRRIFLNMNIHIIAWIIELFGNLSFVLMIWGTQENWTTRGLEVVVGFIYSIAIPYTYLMNSSDIKKMVLDNWIYLAFINKFFPHINQTVLSNNVDNEHSQNNDNQMDA